MRTFAELAQHRHEFVKPEPEPVRPAVRIKVKRPTRPIKLHQRRIEVYEPFDRNIFRGPDTRNEDERIEDAIEGVRTRRRFA